VSKYVAEAYPKGVCAVYCTSGKDIEGPGADFGFAVVISAAKRSPQNFWYCSTHVFCLFLVLKECCHVFFILAHMDQ
jgi:capping protein alpha